MPFASAEQDHPSHLQSEQRRAESYKLRSNIPKFYRSQPPVEQMSNGDIDRYPSGFAECSKTLPHDALGVVLPAARDALRRALDSGRFEDFDKVPLGGTGRLANPVASWAFGLECPDSHQSTLPIPPAFAQAEQAGELVELYWRALTRDLPFSRFGSDPAIAAACQDLNRLRAFGGPKQNGVTTPATIFRGAAAGALGGPHVSQFLWKPIPYGALTVEQRYPAAAANRDFLTAYPDWLSVQNGIAPAARISHDAPRYLSTARDLADYVHSDFSYQAVLNAALILQGYGRGAVSPANPYPARSRSRGSLHSAALVAWTGLPSRHWRR